MTNFKLNTQLFIVLILILSSCKKEDFTYDGEAYIQFSKSELKLDLTQGTNSLEVELNSLASCQNSLKVDIEVSKSSELTEGRHFDIIQETVEFERGSYTSKFKIEYKYENFSADQNSKLILKLKKNNTKIGTRDSLIIHVQQKDWLRSLIGDYEFSYQAKNKEQKGNLKIVELAKKNENSYNLKLVGLPVWTFSSGARQLPDTLEMSFDNYKFEDKILSYESKELSDYAGYKEWLTNFNYGKLSIEKLESNRFESSDNSFVLNYKTKLGTSESIFENLKLRKSSK